jgi:hypothetical protein
MVESLFLIPKETKDLTRSFSRHKIYFFSQKIENIILQSLIIIQSHQLKGETAPHESGLRKVNSNNETHFVKKQENNNYLAFI